jgi:hypothetical protein
LSIEKPIGTHFHRQCYWALLGKQFSQLGRPIWIPMDRAYQEKLFAVELSPFHGQTSSGNISKHTLISLFFNAHFAFLIAHFTFALNAK